MLVFFLIHSTKTTFCQAVREILLVGHRQAFAWIDEWHGMNIEDVRNYETRMQEETNEKVTNQSTVFCNIAQSELSFILSIVLTNQSTVF